jgi:hypothetical protein
MPGIAREQENTSDLINWFISINGVLTDAYQIQYRIFDIIAGLPGTQVFPVTEGEYEDVTSGDGHFSTGSYYAYDNTEVAGWTPAVTEEIGTHRIEWRWKASASSPFQSGSEDFEVLASSVGSSTDLYITVQDVRDEGLLEADYSDDEVLAQIELWQAMIERICRQWFVPKILTMSIDGTDSDAIHFGVPIIDIEYIRINGSTVDLDTSYYKVYSGVQYPDDRRNPRIKLINSTDITDIYSSPLSYSNLKFRKGRQNTEIKGTFGFVDSDGLTPKPIKRALLKLVIEKMINPLYTSTGVATLSVPPLISGLIQEEVTDGHKIKYTSQQILPRKASPFSGITSDQEIIDILNYFRAPVGVASPAHPSHG